MLGKEAYDEAIEEAAESAMAYMRATVNGSRGQCHDILSHILCNLATAPDHVTSTTQY